MNTETPNPYEGDPIKSIKIEDLDFLNVPDGAKMPGPNAIGRIKNALKEKKVIYVGDLDQCYCGAQNALYCKDSLIGNIAKKSIEALGNALLSINYQLKGFEPGDRPKVNTAPKPMKNFAADDFEMVAQLSNEGVEYTIKFKDETLQTQWGNLVRGGYISIAESGEESPQAILQRETLANVALLKPDTDDAVGAITLCYRAKNGGLERLASGSTDVLGGFARAVNQIMPRAQKEVFDRTQQQAAIEAQQIYGAPAP